MNQSEYKPALQWFVEYDLGKYLKGLGGQAHVKVGWSVGNNP